MGTNFYFVAEDGLFERVHIGKRSAAGYYCWDCDLTLHKDGFREYPDPNVSFWNDNRKGVHFNQNWSDHCTYCGKQKEEENDWDDSVGRELGFNKKKPHKKNGVKTASSFSWAIRPSKFFRNRQRKIRDEYNRKYTFEEFLGVLDECPMWSYESIGVDFS